ncbi:Hypothetical_protein [Hexamita inflata]|uniref:Hypothetical_protein n=1 Tax=Hexamita inflata TaxID=28002 RepID=A0AA86R4J8_9EUKA|nr:Hypothetical protein HINF_LOCUS58025 [Hexamita inflata]
MSIWLVAASIRNISLNFGLIAQRRRDSGFSRFKCSEIPGELVSRFILLVFVVAEVGNNRPGSFMREARWNFSVDIHTGYQQQSMQYDHRLSNARVIECLCDLKQRQSQTLRFCDLQSMYGLLCKQLR